MYTYLELFSRRGFGGGRGSKWGMGVMGLEGLLEAFPPERRLDLRLGVLRYLRKPVFLNNLNTPLKSNWKSWVLKIESKLSMPR